MADKPLSVVVIQRFEGLASTVDRDDLRLGLATEQVNCYGRRLGELSPRRGLREITHDGEV